MVRVVFVGALATSGFVLAAWARVFPGDWPRFWVVVFPAAVWLSGLVFYHSVRSRRWSLGVGLLVFLVVWSAGVFSTPTVRGRPVPRWSSSWSVVQFLVRAEQDLDTLEKAEPVLRREGGALISGAGELRALREDLERLASRWADTEVSSLPDLGRTGPIARALSNAGYHGWLAASKKLDLVLQEDQKIREEYEVSFRRYLDWRDLAARQVGKARRDLEVRH